MVGNQSKFETVWVIFIPGLVTPGQRTKSGAIVLSEGEGETGDERGLTDEQMHAIRGGGFFDPGAFDDVKVVKRKAYVHLMPGLPNELFFASAILILLLSFFPAFSASLFLLSALLKVGQHPRRSSGAWCCF